LVGMARRTVRILQRSCRDLVPRCHFLKYLKLLLQPLAIHWRAVFTQFMIDNEFGYLLSGFLQKDNPIRPVIRCCF
jgi:hypothetical protein